jgi:hypothetical protein
MDFEKTWSLILAFESEKRLVFESEDHIAILRDRINWMSDNSRGITLTIMEKLLNPTGGFVCKIVKLSKPPKPGIHFSRNFDNWSVVGWIFPNKKIVNLNLRNGTDLSGINLQFRKIPKSSSPHNIIIPINTIEQASQIYDLLCRSEKAWD